MSYLDIVDKVLEEQKKKKSEPLRIVDIPLLTLSELSRRDMAIEIYSEILNCNIWLCSDEEMVAQVKRDVPEAVCYTAHEVIQLIRLKPYT